MMTTEEIVRSYRSAKSPLKQIGILADLNNCKKAAIVDQLKLGGVTEDELPAQYRKGWQDHLKASKTDDNNDESSKIEEEPIIPDDMVEALRGARGYLAALDIRKKELLSELDQINSKVSLFYSELKKIGGKK